MLCNIEKPIISSIIVLQCESVPDFEWLLNGSAIVLNDGGAVLDKGGQHCYIPYNGKHASYYFQDFPVALDKGDHRKHASNHKLPSTPWTRAEVNKIC